MKSRLLVATAGCLAMGFAGLTQIPVAAEVENRDETVVVVDNRHELTPMIQSMENEALRKGTSLQDEIDAFYAAHHRSPSRVDSEGPSDGFYVESDVMIDGMTEAEFHQLSALAVSEGVDLATAIERWGQAQAAGDVAGRLEEAPELEISGSEFGGDGTLRVYFRGAVPNSVEQEFSGVAHRVELIPNSGVSPSDAADLAASITTQLQTKWASVSTSVEAGRPTLHFEVSGDLASDSAAELAAMPGSVAKGGVQYSIDYTVVQRREELAYRGGGNTLRGTPLTPWCSTGFTVQNLKTGNKRATTAGHCRTDTHWQGLRVGLRE